MATFTSFSPDHGTIGDIITIIGTGLTGATNVTFGNVSAHSITHVSDTELQCELGNSLSGNVQVFAPGGPLTLPGFTYDSIPVIDSFTPIATPPGNPVTISGSGFTGAIGVKFGGIDALFFTVVDDSTIIAYPDFNGSNTVNVITPSGSVGLAGFTLLLTKVRLIDLPQLNRIATPDDLGYVWDSIRGKLCQSPFSNIPGSGGGDGSGIPGNIYTALGSPFKVRVGDENYQFDAAGGADAPGAVTITDVRLLGKTDYVVSASDVSNEFENDRLTFDADAGTVVISKYQLTGTKHITIYADGIVTTQFTAFMTSMQAQLAKLMKVAAPFLPSVDSNGDLANPGGLVPWFRPAIEIPDGWAEWIPGRGKGLRGQDPSDVYDATTNPEGLSRANGSSGGSKNGVALVADNIPEIQLKLFSSGAPSFGINTDPNKPVAWSTNHLNGNQDYDIRRTDAGGVPTLGVSSKFGKPTPDAVKKNLDPYRIVNFIYSTQTA
jgi:hypothetical protein